LEISRALFDAIFSKRFGEVVVFSELQNLARTLVTWSDLTGGSVVRAGRGRELEARFFQFILLMMGMAD